MRNQKFAATIKTDTTDAVEPVEDDTAVPARDAADTTVFQPFVEFAFRRERLQNFFKRGGFRCTCCHKICFPNADKINSVPKWAVLLCSSRIGLISVISNDAIFRVSATISIARWASR